MRGLVAIVAVAACGGDGVYIEIRTGGLGATRVDLFLTDGSPCKVDDEGCGAIGLPVAEGNGQRVMFDGKLFLVDNPEPFRSDVSGGSAWFYLAPGGDKVEFAVAIGRDADGAIVGTRILTELGNGGGALHVRTELVATDSAIGAGAVSAAIWPRDDAPYHCVAAEEGGHRVAIVPAKDPDCDFVNANECEPTVHLANEPPSPALEDQRCATDDVIRGVCVLGDHGCVDGAADRPEAGCTPGPITYCVPDAVCTSCPDLGEQCVASLVDTAKIVCKLRVADRNATGTLTVCNGPITRAATLGDGPCETTVGILPLTAPLGTFSDRLDIVIGGSSVTIQPQIIDETPCRFSVSRPDAMFPVNVFPHVEQAIVKIGIVGSGATVDRYALLPLEVDFELAAECNEPSPDCQLASTANERITACFKP